MALSRTTRRFIVSGLVALFLLIAPLLILYARGYRYDFVEKEVEKVGMIMLAYDPFNASSFVDGLPAPFDITALGYDRFPNLPTGTYGVDVAREGYHDWQKKLDVSPEIVTWARYITLFLDPPIIKDQVKESDITATDFSPNREWLCSSSQTNDKTFITIKSLQAEEESKSFALSTLVPRLNDKQTVSEIIFAPDSTNILLKVKGEDKQTTHVIFSRELAEDDPVVILEDILPELNSLKWHPSNASIVYAKQASDLYRLSLIPSPKSKRLASNVLGFEPTKFGLYFTRPREEQVRQETQANFKVMALDGSNPKTISEDIELAETYDIAISGEQRMAVLTSSGSLYAVEEDRTERIATDVQQINWSIDNDEEDSTVEQLLYSNEHEIYTFDPDIYNSEAITRYTEEIGNAIWYNGNYKYVIFTVGNRIKIIELDERDHRNVADIWQADDGQTIEENTLVIDNDAEHIFLEIHSTNEEIIKDFLIRE